MITSFPIQTHPFALSEHPHTLITPSVASGQLTIGAQGGIYDISLVLPVTTITIAHRNDNKAHELLLILRQGTGNNLVRWNGVSWSGGLAPVLRDDASDLDVVRIVTHAGGAFGSFGTSNVLTQPPVISDIGTPGEAGFPNGIYPGILPFGWSEMTGTKIVGHENYGNYQYMDGSVCVWWPAFYYRIGHVENPTYPTYGVNSVDVKNFSDFQDEAAANAQGYALWRSFKNGGIVRLGKMIDKYTCSNNGGIASSIKYGSPLSSALEHNPYSELNGSPDNHYYGALDAVKTRGQQFHVMSRFDRIGRMICSMAHGQASTSATHCAWYDPTGTTNYPKGNTNRALGDVDDPEVYYVTDGFNDAAKTGSGFPFAKTTDNGQNCGVADLSGSMWDINTGMTRTGTDSINVSEQTDDPVFYVLKESVDMSTLTSGWSNADGFGAPTDAWGNETHLLTLYDPISLPHIGHGSVWNTRFGNGANQVLSPALSGDGYKQTALGIYTSNGHSLDGTNLYGSDGLFEYRRANLCMISGGSFYNPNFAGPWCLALTSARTNAAPGVGVRAAAYV